MRRDAACLPLLSRLAGLLLVILLAGCGTPHPPPTPTRAAPSPTGTPTRTALPPTPTATATATATAAAAATTTPEPTATLVRPEIYSGHGLSVQAEWVGSPQPAFDWSPDGMRLAFTGPDGVHVLRTDTYETLWNGPAAQSVAFSANGQHLAIATGERIELRAAGDGREVTGLAQAPCAQAERVGFKADGSALVVAWVDQPANTVNIGWLDIASGACSQPFAKVPGHSIGSFALSLERDFVLAAVENQVYLWFTSDGKEAARQPGQAAVFNPGGYFLAVKAGDTITVFETKSHEVVQTFQLPGAQAFGLSAAWSMLAVSTPNGPAQQIHFYDAEYQRLKFILRDLPAETQVLSFSPDNQRLLVVAQPPGQPSRFLLLGLSPGLASSNPDLTGSLQLTQPAPTPAPLFPVLYTKVNGQNEFPTPIAPPDRPAQDYRLKPWNESRGIAMIQPLVEFATANDVFGAASSRGEFMWPQGVIRLAALEFLQRFPASPHTTAVQWRLALSNTVADRHDSDAWILAQIEQGLNDGSINPADSRINAYLEPFGFVIDTSLYPALQPATDSGVYCGGAANPVLAPNLFGDGGRTQIVLIRSVWGNIGIIAAVHQDKQGRYQLIPIHSSLNFGAGRCQTVLAQDVTGDGRPEIWVEEAWHSGSMDSQTSYIYQWREGHFVDVSDGTIGSFDFPYEIKLSGSPGQAKIIQFNFYDALSGEGTRIYTWDGEQFKAASNHIPPDIMQFDLKGKFYIYNLFAALDQRQYPQIAGQIRSFLNNPQKANTLHPEDAALLHFQLAMSEAFQFRPAEARAVLQDWLKTQPSGDLTQNSQDKSLIVPYQQAAQAFLKVYQTETDLSTACQAVEGVSPQISYQSCSVDTAAIELARRAVLLDPAKLAQVLKGYGVKLSLASSFEANDDGKPDWIFMAERRPDDETNTSVWLLISNQNRYEAVHILTYPTPGSAATPVEFRVVNLPGATDKAYLLRVGEVLRVYTIQFKTQPRVNTLFSALNVSSYQEQSSADTYDLLISHDSDRYQLPEIVRWDSQSNQFLTYDYAEYLVLTKNQPQEAIRLIPIILDKLKTIPEDNFWVYLKYTEPPRLQYLLGLAYELSGDTANAARVYYDLWRTPPSGNQGHPEQPYAIMAREKLERLQP